MAKKKLKGKKKQGLPKSLCEYSVHVFQRQDGYPQQISSLPFRERGTAVAQCIECESHGHIVELVNNFRGTLEYTTPDHLATP